MSGFGDQLFSGDTHLWWRGADPGAKLSIRLDAPRAGRYRAIAHLTKARDHGIHQFSVNWTKAGEPVDFSNPRAIPAEPGDLGVHELRKEGNALQVEITGTNPRAQPKSYMFGLDCIVLKPAERP